MAGEGDAYTVPVAGTNRGVHRMKPNGEVLLYGPKTWCPPLTRFVSSYLIFIFLHLNFTFQLHAYLKNAFFISTK